MTSNFPTSLDNLDPTRGTDSDRLSSPNHVTHHTNEDDAIEALEAKVGVDGSAVTTSLDYKLKSTSSSNPGHKHTLANGATDVTASSTELNYSVGVTSAVQTQLDAKIPKSLVDAKGDILVATADNTVTRLAVGANGKALLADSAQTEGIKWGDVIQSADIQIFTTPGANTWTKPTGAKAVEVYVFGGGGGGGGGRRDSNSGADTKGGSAGGGGSVGFKRFNASGLGSTETVTIGAGGGGGAGKSSDADGNAGVDGGPTTFGTATLLKAYGGIKGIGGTNNIGSVTGGVGGIAGNGELATAGGDGGNGSDVNGTAGTDTAVLISPRGGGGGGGCTGGSGSSNTGSVGGGFITNYVKAGGAVGTIGNSSITLFYGGTGGGGGTGSTGGAGINGSGGGGGGASRSTSGAGGQGGDGVCIVITYF